MSLRLLIDEDTQARRLVEMLRAESHDVLTISEANMTGVPDTIVMEFARNQQLVLLTRNCDDFLELHKANPEHSGILAIYQDADLTKGMSYTGIVKAIANLEKTGLPLKKLFVVINQYNYLKFKAKIPDFKGEVENLIVRVRSHSLAAIA